MVKKLFDKLIKDNLEVLSNGLKGLWEKLPKGGAAAGGGGGSANENFDKLKEKMGTMAGKEMKREEALQILAIEEDEHREEDHDSDEETIKIPAELIMERFEALIQKNQVANGGSFYLQSKIYWAKHQLMLDHPKELNTSEWNPIGELGHRAVDKVEEEPEDVKKEEDKK